MFQYSFSLCLVAFFFAILRLSDGRRTTATDIAGTVDCAWLSTSTSLPDACVCTGVRCWGWLVSAIKWTNEGYKTIRFGFLFGVLCWLLFLFGSLRFHFFLFSSSSFFLRQSILLLYVFPFSCRPLGWSLYLYLFVGSQEGERRGTCKVLVCLLEYPFWGSVPAWVRSGFMLSRWVFLFAFWVCLLTRQTSVRSSHCTSGCPTIPSRLSVRPFVCPVYVIAHISF